jgi:hypothetical protein
LGEYPNEADDRDDNQKPIHARTFTQYRKSAAALMPARPMAGLMREPDGQCAHHHAEYRQRQNDNRCFAHCSLSDFSRAIQRRR